ncbi:hypothetical protein BDZ89DRAFT_1133472 [Hymenopellis radicata]|nr:hypothetical protein BDZ89DRAFT_1133472 [Hymenopellis radicata]
MHSHAGSTLQSRREHAPQTLDINAALQRAQHPASRTPPLSLDIRLPPQVQFHRSHKYLLLMHSYLRNPLSFSLNHSAAALAVRVSHSVDDYVFPTSNDDILRGLLGVIGMRPDRHQELISQVEQDVKPTITHEAEYYDHYYASLAASSVSAQATPSGMSAPGSSDFDDVGNDDEDRKPSVEYLDSLNDYRKRSRSRENEGDPGRFKVPKVEDVAPCHGPNVGPPLTNGNGNGIVVVNGDTPQAMIMDDPMIMCTISQAFVLSNGFVDVFSCRL